MFSLVLDSFSCRTVCERESLALNVFWFDTESVYLQSYNILFTAGAVKAGSDTESSRRLGAP